MPTNDDPGWSVGWRSFAFLVPGLAGRLAKTAPGDRLVALRQVFTSFLVALAILQVVLISIGTEPAVKPEPHFAIALLAVGALNVFALSPFLLARQPLTGQSAKQVAGSYNTRFFLQVAFAESAALFGFVSFFVANVWWAYPLSLVSAVIGFARLAPTRRNLAREQESLRRSGSNVSLVRALRGLD